MAPDTLIEVTRQGLWLIVLLASLIIGPSLIVGLIVSVFQAATQINEQTLSFLPRLIVTILVVIFGGPWIMGQLVDFAHQLFVNIPYLIS
jgi:flagellar biosynthetic protein FliQ